MGILIDQAPDNTWRMVVREQFFLPDAKAGKELIDYLMEKGIVFGVTYTNKVVVHLHDVEYIDENYEGFLKVVGELLVYKKKYGVKPRIPTEEERMQAMYAQRQAQQEAMAQQEMVRQQAEQEAYAQQVEQEAIAQQQAEEEAFAQQQ